MDSPVDNTAVIRMQKDFNAFIADKQGRKRTRLNLDKCNLFNDFSQQSVHSSSIKTSSVRSHEDKLKQAEVIAAKSTISRLESTIGSLETSNKRAKIEYDRDLDSCRIERKKETNKLSELKAQLQFISDRERQAKEELAEYRKVTSEKKHKNDDKICALQKMNRKLEEDLQEVKHSSQDMISELKRELMRRSSDLYSSQNDLEEMHAQMEDHIRRASESSFWMRDIESYRVQATRAEQKVRELELAISRMEEDATIARAMKSQLSKAVETEKENRKLTEENSSLREGQENMFLIKEQLEGMRKKLDRSEQRSAECNQLALENNEIKGKLKRWEAVDPSGKSRPQSPSQLMRMIAELQNSQAVLLEKEGHLQARIHSQDETIASIKQENGKHQQSANQIRRLQRRLLLVTKERDGYKNIIDSYENELTINVASHAGVRIHNLEENLQSHQRQIEYLEGEISRLSGDLPTSHSGMQTHPKLSSTDTSIQSQIEASNQKTILQLREKIVDLEKRLEATGEEKQLLEDRMEQRHLQGEYDPTRTKVLHFSKNPTALAQEKRSAELVKLREENERLVQRVKLLEENSGHVTNLTLQVEEKLSEPSTSMELEEVKLQLSSAKLKNDRLMEAFKKTSTEFREVCYQLTGYKIDILSSSQYRLTSMYASSSSDNLLFKQSSGGSIQMLETAYSNTLSELIDLYLLKQDSIPAFLSSHTMTLFSAQTMML